MGTLKKQPVEGQRGKDPDVVGALRDWVGQDHRIATESNTDRSGTSSGSDGTNLEDAAELAKDLFNADERASSARAHLDRYDFHIAPPIQGVHDPDSHQADFQGDVTNTSAEEEAATAGTPFRIPVPRPEATRAFSVTRRVARTLAHGLVAIAVAGVIVAFLSDDSLRLAGGSIQSATPETQGAGEGLPTNELNPVLQQQLALRQQLERIANDLASTRRTVERLAIRQDETEQNIATLRASEQYLRQEITALGQATVPNPSTHSRRHRRNR
jgi:hypothetical protein